MFKYLKIKKFPEKAIYGLHICGVVGGPQKLLNFKSEP